MQQIDPGTLAEHLERLDEIRWVDAVFRARKMTLGRKSDSEYSVPLIKPYSITALYYVISGTEGYAYDETVAVVDMQVQEVSDCLKESADGTPNTDSLQGLDNHEIMERLRQGKLIYVPTSEAAYDRLLEAIDARKEVLDEKTKNYFLFLKNIVLHEGFISFARVGETLFATKDDGIVMPGVSMPQRISQKKTTESGRYFHI